jgi:hypothetical protein
MASIHTPKISKAPAAAFWLRRHITFTAPMLLDNYISKISYLQCWKARTMLTHLGASKTLHLRGTHAAQAGFFPWLHSWRFIRAFQQLSTLATTGSLQSWGTLKFADSTTSYRKSFGFLYDKTRLAASFSHQGQNANPLIREWICCRWESKTRVIWKELGCAVPHQTMPWPSAGFPCWRAALRADLRDSLHVRILLSVYVVSELLLWIMPKQPTLHAAWMASARATLLCFRVGSGRR